MSNIYAAASLDAGPDFGRPRTRLVPALQERIAADEARRAAEVAAADRRAPDWPHELPPSADMALPPGTSGGDRSVAPPASKAWSATKALLGTTCIYLAAVLMSAFALAFTAGFIQGASGASTKLDLGQGTVLLANVLVLLLLVWRGRRGGRTPAELLAPPADWRHAARLMLPRLIGFAALAAFIALVTVLAPKLMDHGPTTVGGLAKLKGAAWITATLTAIVAAPLVEELVFRGHLQSKLRAAGLGERTTLALATLLFTLFHLPLPIGGLLVIFGLGWACGRLRERTGSVLPGMVLHAGWNIAIVLIAMLAAAAGKV